MSSSNVKKDSMHKDKVENKDLGYNDLQQLMA